MRKTHHKKINKIFLLVLAFLFLLLATVAILLNLLILAILLIILGMALLILPFAKHQTKKEHTFNSQILTILGIIWFITGITTENPGLRASGLAFLILWLTQRKKNRHQKTRSQLSHKDKKTTIIILIFWVCVLTFGVLYLFLG